ncbi:hypothetical protein P43SY_004434 [Pythium insidiosum]|uniref:Uncharacterized protein n=1 Tax=Pythium insidiosum TaxID=114742 RepID=A0AAD5QEE9_PYTIN|nr:hypothetical protein P43SY_004434 [Pythium insidiosum]
MQATSGSSNQVLGCEHRVLGGDYTEGAVAWQINMNKVDLPANSRLLVKAVQADQKDDHPAWAAMTGRPMSDGKSLVTAHTVLPGERCSWSFVVSAPGFRLDYEPPSDCKSSDVKQSSTAYSASVLRDTTAGKRSTCGSPAVTQAPSTPPSTGAPSSSDATARAALVSTAAPQCVCAAGRCGWKAVDVRLASDLASDHASDHTSDHARFIYIKSEASYIVTVDEHGSPVSARVDRDSATSVRR